MREQECQGGIHRTITLFLSEIGNKVSIATASHLCPDSPSPFSQSHVRDYKTQKYRLFYDTFLYTKMLYQFKE